MSDEYSAWRRKIQTAKQIAALEQNLFDAASDRLQNLFTVIFANPRQAVEQFRIDVRREGLNATISKIEKQHSDNPFVGDYRLKGAGLEVLSDRRTVERAKEARDDIASTFRDFETALDRKSKADQQIARLRREQEDAKERLHEKELYQETDRDRDG